WRWGWGGRRRFKRLHLALEAERLRLLPRLLRLLRIAGGELLRLFRERLRQRRFLLWRPRRALVFGHASLVIFLKMITERERLLRHRDRRPARGFKHVRHGNALLQQLADDFLFGACSRFGG